MSTELQELKKDIRDQLPAREASTLIGFVEKMDSRIKKLEREARVQKDRADKVKLPHGALVTNAPEGSTVVVLGGMSVSQRRDLRDAFRKHLLATNDPAIAPTRALDPYSPRYGEAVIKTVGPGGMLDEDDTVQKARGESASWRKTVFAASLRPGGAALT